MNDSAFSDPVKFVERFKTKESYQAWCQTHTIVDLQKHLKALEEEELYHHCAVAFAVINAKIDAAEADFKG